MRPRFLLPFACLSLLGALPAHARWATEADATAAIDFEHEEITVHADGTYVDEIDEQAEILKEDARTRYGSRHLHYNSRASRIKILKAETLNGTQITPVNSSMIEDKPLASAGEGFDQTNQVLIGFPDIKTGSKTHLKYRYEAREIPFPGIFYSHDVLSPDAFVRESRTRYVSELPLYVEINDPRKLLQVTQTRDGERFVVTVQLVKPAIDGVRDESQASLNSRDRTWVAVSSAKSYAEMGNQVAEKIEAVIGSELPPLYQSILEAAKQEHTLSAKLNTITSQLAQSVRYLGDWRPIQGGFIPRPLATVAETRFGDCKDFATALASILRKMGYEAHLAYIERAWQPRPWPKVATLPTNHAITWARVDGKVYWLDPTNFESFAQGIFADVIGRDALVLDPKDPRVERIPDGKSEDAGYREKWAVELGPGCDTRSRIRMSYLGRAAIPLTGSLLRLSKESNDHRILTWFVPNEARITSSKVDDYDLSSRITRDIDLGITLTENDACARTSAGPSYRLTASALARVLMDLETENRVSDYFMGQPFGYEKTYELKGISMVGGRDLSCQIESPWLDASRRVTPKPWGVEVRDHYVSHGTTILNRELKTPKFRNFQARLRKCFDETGIVFRLRGSARRIAGDR